MPYNFCPAGQRISDAPKGEWRAHAGYPTLREYWVDGRMVAWLDARPAYCDRGHWYVEADVPNQDAADGFPRYYMSHAVAVAETEAFIAWRLFKKRVTA